MLGAAGKLKRRRPATSRKSPAADPSADVDDEDDDAGETPADEVPADETPTEDDGSTDAPAPSTAEVRAWAREHDFPVSDRGRLRAEVWEAYTAAHPER
ncbi:Lsr2 family protein [Rhodococcus pseudokoreensis]|uniref:Lsr2 family protein n=1 Tax=Rhodococcus pseudokoreensis TaxID=2811421 RepID=A0A974WDF5_9NOCA|nr:Lsr2 family protein [Rhodococcus pseudokoreensis]